MKKKITLVILLFTVMLLIGSFSACKTASEEAEVLNITNATINGKDISMFVEHDVDSVSLANAVQTSVNSTWVLSYDNLGQNVIANKVAASTNGKLSDGNNVFYVTVTAEDGKHSNVYTLTIYKSFAVTISFYDDDSLLTEKQAYTGKEYVIDYVPDLGIDTFNFWYFADAPQTQVKSFTPWENTSLYANKTLAPLSDEAEIKSVTNATINGKEISMFVEHDVDSVSLANIVQTSKNSTWVLSYDNLGQNVIANKVAASTNGKLSDGNNVFYVTVTAEDGAHSNVYTLTIYKSFAVTISFYDGDSLLTEKQAYTGKEYVIDYAETFVGYNFNYWYFADAPETQVTSFVPWEDASLFANKSLKILKVTLDINGGDSLAQSEFSIEYSASFSLPVPTYANHRFTGWYNAETQITDENGQGLQLWNYENDVTLVAGWQEVYTITVTGTEGGGIIDNSGVYLYGEQLSLFAETHDGYTWLGWFKNGAEFSKNFELTVSVEESATYVATWIAFPLVINFQVSLSVKNDYAYVTPVELPSKTVVGEQITLTAPQTSQLGYQFVGWYDSSFSATGKLLSNQLEYTLAVPNKETKLYVRYDKKEEMKFYSFNSTDTECIITSASSDIADSDVVIPDYVTELRSSNSARGVFQNLNMLSVVVGTGITQIPDKTFQSNAKLTKVELKGKVTYIGQFAFYGCKVLETVTFGSALQNIDYAAFSQCTVLSELGNLENVVSLGIEAFNQSGISTIELPAVESIGDNAFKNCANLKSVNLGNKLATLGTGAFSQSGLTSVTIPGSLKVVSTSAFANCSSLSSITIEEGVEELENLCFSYTAVTEVIVADSVTTIYRAFYGCGQLESITFGLNLNYIGLASFDRCNNLTYVIFKNKEGWVRQRDVSPEGDKVLDSSLLEDPKSACDLFWDSNRSEYWKRIDV